VTASLRASAPTSVSSEPGRGGGGEEGAPVAVDLEVGGAAAQGLCQLLTVPDRTRLDVLARKQEDLDGERDGDEVALWAVELPPARLWRLLELDLLVRWRLGPPAGRRRGCARHGRSSTTGSSRRPLAPQPASPRPLEATTECSQWPQTSFPRPGPAHSTRSPRPHSSRNRSLPHQLWVTATRARSADACRASRSALEALGDGARGRNASLLRCRRPGLDDRRLPATILFARLRTSSPSSMPSSRASL